jgi:hypothetical protein
MYGCAMREIVSALLSCDFPGGTVLWHSHAKGREGLPLVQTDHFHSNPLPDFTKVSLVTDRDPISLNGTDGHTGEIESIARTVMYVSDSTSIFLLGKSL